MRINCKHLVKEDNGCGVNKGCGWNGEYCSVSHLGKDCDHQEERHDRVNKRKEM